MSKQLMSLTNIFSFSLYRIPDYQRGYAWGEKEVTDYWNDLCRLEVGKNHYVGVLTLEPVPKEIYINWINDTWLTHNKNYIPYYVVDGQQRLTTSILLLVAILEVMDDKNIDQINYSDKNEIHKQFIAESKKENKSKSYLFSYEENNPSYKHLLNHIYCNKIPQTDIFEETVYTANLDYTKEFFKNKLADLNLAEIESIYTKVTQHFLFNVYEISEDIDVFVTFETMNNRGKRLSQLELLKNRLIYLSTLFSCEEENCSRLRKKINDCWKDIYHFLGQNKRRRLSDDEFLSAHFKTYFYKNQNDIYGTRGGDFRLVYRLNIEQKYLLESYFVPSNISTGQLKIEDVFDYIESLHDSILYWTFINNPQYSKYSGEIKEYLKKLHYLTEGDIYINSITTANYSLARVLMLAVMKKNIPELTLKKFLKALERYLFVLLLIPVHIVIRQSKGDIKYLDINAQTVQFLDGKKTATEVINKLSRSTDAILNSADAKKVLSTYYSKNGFYESDVLRYLLCEYEMALYKQSKTNIERLDRDVYFSAGHDSIEHIYPQSAYQKYWTNIYKKYTARQKSLLRDSLGNFVLLSEKKNGKLGNKAFPEKKENSQNCVGYKYGTYSEIELTRYEDWSGEQILDRGLKMTNFICDRWKIQIGNGTKADKIAFLGLSFLMDNPSK